MSVREYLEEGFLGKLTNPRSLTGIIGLNDESAARSCFVSPETYRRWCTDRKPNKCAIKLLSILAGRFPWPGWERFFYNAHDQKIYTYDLKHGFAPGDLHSLFYMKQGYEHLERENRELRHRLEELEQSAASRASILASANVVAFPDIKANRSIEFQAQSNPDSPVAIDVPRWLAAGIRGFIRRMVK